MYVPRVSVFLYVCVFVCMCVYVHCLYYFDSEYVGM